MDLKEFRPNGLRTESTIEQVKANELAVKILLRTYIHIGNMLDQVKKNVFYGKPYDLLKWANHKTDLAALLKVLDDINPAEQLDPVDVNSRLFHGIIGMCTESTELAEALIAGIDGEEVDWVNLGEEIGDCNWYENIILDELNVDWETVLDTVINKLKARFPDKFTPEDAINRDIDTERRILENGLSS